MSHSTLAAALPEADGATAAWLELAELGSAVCALKLCAGSSSFEANGTATLALADSRAGAPGGCC